MTTPDQLLQEMLPQLYEAAETLYRHTATKLNLELRVNPTIFQFLMYQTSKNIKVDRQDGVFYNYRIVIDLGRGQLTVRPEESPFAGIAAWKADQ